MRCVIDSAHAIKISLQPGDQKIPLLPWPKTPYHITRCWNHSKHLSNALAIPPHHDNKTLFRSVYCGIRHLCVALIEMSNECCWTLALFIPPLQPRLFMDPSSLKTDRWKKRGRRGKKVKLCSVLGELLQFGGEPPPIKTLTGILPTCCITMLFRVQFRLNLLHFECQEKVWSCCACENVNWVCLL